LKCTQNSLALYDRPSERGTLEADEDNYHFMTDFVNTVPVSNHIEKPANLTLITGVNAVFGLFLTVAGFLIAGDLEFYSNGFKLIGAVHGALELGFDIEGEVFFYSLAVLGLINLLGSTLFLRRIKLGFWIQVLALLPLAVMGLIGLSKFSMLWGYTGIVGVSVFYGISVVAIALLVANFRCFRRLG
jgi:hypothetical protein